MANEYARFNRAASKIMFSESPEEQAKRRAAEHAASELAVERMVAKYRSRMAGEVQVMACEVLCVRKPRSSNAAAGSETVAATGTLRGYKLHKEAGERSCSACQQAKWDSYASQHEQRHKKRLERERGGGW